MKKIKEIRFVISFSIYNRSAGQQEKEIKNKREKKSYVQRSLLIKKIFLMKDQVQVLYYFFIIKLGNKNDEKNER